MCYATIIKKLTEEEDQQEVRCLYVIVSTCCAPGRLAVIRLWLVRRDVLSARLSLLFRPVG